MQETQTQTISWNVPEYREHARGKRWYMVAAGASALLLLYSVLTANFLFAIILVLAILIMAAHDRKAAPEVTFEIAENGINVGAAHYSYNRFKNFWMYYEPGEAKTLFFEFKSGIRPRLAIPLQNKNPLKVRSILLVHLPEDVLREDEPLSEQLIRLLKL
ncbi:MAG: hypothetical protein HYT31_02360 [Parcubacteria group bacterium]|nr:hypothetical protein [Parcubacteria group bacterium]